MKVKKIDVLIESDKDFFSRAKGIARDIDKGRFPKKPVRTVSFAQFEDLKKVLTRERLKLLHAIKQNRPASLYALAQQVKRTPENVLRDIQLLEELGFVELEKQKKERKRTAPKIGYEKIQIGIQI